MTASPATDNPTDTSRPDQVDAAEVGAKQSPAPTALTNTRPTWWPLRRPRHKRAAAVVPHKLSGALFARAVTFGVVPVLAIALTLAAGWLKYLAATDNNAADASIESVSVAKDAAVAMLSYTPATAEKNLTAAGDRMTGPFRDSYASLIHDVVIPGAKEKNVSAVATVPAAAAMSASADHAVVLVYVNQAITVGNSAPTQTSSVVQVTLDRSGEQWLISGFDPK